MTDTTEDILETMRAQLHEMELDHVQLAGRIMQHRTSMALVEHGGRRANAGSLSSTSRSATSRAVTSLDDVQGILKTEETAA
jgi:hypothetical protein